MTTKIQYFYKDVEVSKEQLLNLFTRHLKEMDIFYRSIKDDEHHFQTMIKNSLPFAWVNGLPYSYRQAVYNTWLPLVSTSAMNSVIEKFFKFLDTHNCRKEYLFNIEMHPHNDLMSSITCDSLSKIKFLLSYYDNGFDIINGSFLWSKTEQGLDFWRRLNDEWNDIVRFDNMYDEYLRFCEAEDRLFGGLDI